MSNDEMEAASEARPDDQHYAEIEKELLGALLALRDGRAYRDVLQRAERVQTQAERALVALSEHDAASPIVTPDSSIYKLHLPPPLLERVAEWLGVTTVRELAAISLWRLLAVPGIGRRKLAMIKEEMEKHGFPMPRVLHTDVIR